MITIIGTGHVFNLTQGLIETFDERQPDILCIELDRQRFNALMLKQTDPEKYKQAGKNLPPIYKMLARMQEGLAEEYGVQPGQEMLTTIHYAQTHQIPIEFIDMNAQKLFSKMLKKMSIREKIRLLFSGFGGLFVSKKKVESELNDIQDNFDTYINQISKKFPTIKKILIDDRNQYMVNQIKRLNERYQTLIAVVGDGHVPGLGELLKKENIDFDTIRLSQLRKISEMEKDPSSASFSISQDNL